MGSTSIAGRRTRRLWSKGLALALVGLAWSACAARETPSSDPSRTPGGVPRRSEAPPPLDATRSEEKPLRVATSGDYAPFSVWPGSAEEPQGFSVAVARAFARSSGRKLEWVRFAWPELTAGLAAERFDLVLSGVTIRPDRSALGRFSLPLVATGAVALVRADSRLRRAEELNRPSIRIAVNRGGHLERVAHAAFGRARIEAVEGNAAVPGRLANGAADAVVTDELEAPRWQSTLPPTRVLGPFTRDRKAAWLPASRTSLARELDAWLLGAERSGELAALRRLHGLPDEATALPLPALLAKLDERLALMPDVARAKHALGGVVEDAAQEARVRDAAWRAAEGAAAALRTAPPAREALMRFIDAQMRAARFLQARALAASPRPEADAALREHARAERSAEAARRALDLGLRPAIAHLTERIVWLVVAASLDENAPAPEGSTARHDSAADPASESPKRPAPRHVEASDESSSARSRGEALRIALARHALPEDLLSELERALDALLDPPHVDVADPVAQPAARQ